MLCRGPDTRDVIDLAQFSARSPSTHDVISYLKLQILVIQRDGGSSVRGLYEDNEGPIRGKGIMEARQGLSLFGTFNNILFYVT